MINAPSKLTTDSSIHGVSYIFNVNHSKSVRVFWTFAFLLSICGFCFYIERSYVKTFINPDFGMNINQKLSRDIPFPAITICSPLFTRDKIVDIRKYYQKAMTSEGKFANLTKRECDYFSANSHWCLANYAEYSTCDDDPKRNVEFLEKGSLSVEEFFLACAFNLNFKNCSHLFNKVLTDVLGFCYTYNMQGFDEIFNDGISEDFVSYRRRSTSKISSPNFQETSNVSLWSLETGYKTNREEVYPIRAMKFHDLAFAAMLKNIDAENFCSIKAALVILHLPSEVPTPFHTNYIVPYGKMKNFDLTAKSYTAEKDLKKFKPKFRKCYFKGEKRLKFFKSYTKNHCEFECMSNYTLQTCGCVKYSMPRENSTKICRLRDAKCYYKITSRYPNVGEKNVDCKCYPSCIDIKYGVHSTSESVYDDWSEISHLNLNKSADFGGLLGLFMGCSMLSIIEIFYTLIRWILCCSKRENKTDRTQIETPVIKSKTIFVSHS